MDTPGFKHENEIKPEITAQIEGTSSTTTPIMAAQMLLAQVIKGRYVICNDLLGELIRVCANGAVPRPNPVTEALALPLISTILNIWVPMADFDVRNYFSKAPKVKEDKKTQ
ncbi:3-dehydrosphinganine reductase [Blyttiomyces sp. JEL0837]|nr:3-dehydrosphinganine reductase [Blyttiomyces sp. JEL0837]